MEIFLESVVFFFGQNNYTNIRRFWAILNKGLLISEKVQKIQVWVQWLYNIYLTKLKVGYFHYLLKTLKYKYCPDQEKLLEKVDGG